jgi:phage baseplate assembly protein W
MNINFPFSLDGRGRSAEASDEKHILDMIEQFIFTNPGERVNRPDFGSGLQQLIFAPDSPELASALQFTMQAGLNRWLGDLIELRALEVQSNDSQLLIKINYVVRSSNEARSAQLSRRLSQ